MAKPAPDSKPIAQKALATTQHLDDSVHALDLRSQSPGTPQIQEALSLAGGDVVPESRERLLQQTGSDRPEAVIEHVGQYRCAKRVVTMRVTHGDA